MITLVYLLNTPFDLTHTALVDFVIHFHSVKQVTNTQLYPHSTGPLLRKCPKKKLNVYNNNNNCPYLAVI